MSSTSLEVQRRAREIRRKRLEALGLADQYDLWRESLPDADMPDNDAYDLFMSAQEIEGAAQSGRLSVATGDPQEDTATTIPTPGPDGEGTRPDEAGDTSKGPDDGPTLSDLIAPPPDPTALKLVEGMWTPPPEAETENYSSPSTYQMSRSKDWLENAQIVYDFMNPPKEKQPSGGDVVFGGFMGSSSSEVLGKEEERQTGDRLGEWARNEMSGFNWNVANTMAYAQKIMSSGDPKVALAFLNLINMYDHSDGGAKDFAGAIGEVMTDPTTYLGFGAGGLVAKGAAKAVAKTGLKKAIQGGIIAGSAGLTEGAMLGGGFDLTVQNIEQEAGVREDIDKGRVGAATAMGGGLGLLLGGSIGSWAGRKADKWTKAIADQKLKDKQRDALLDKADEYIPSPSELRGQELNEKELIDMLRASGRASQKAGKVDLDTAIANQLEMEGIPRNNDGSIDYDEVVNIISEVKGKYALLEQEKLAKDAEFETIDGERVYGYRNDKLSDVEADAKHGLTPEEVFRENGFVGHPKTARVGKLLNDQDIFIRATTEDSIIFDLDAGVGYDINVNDEIKTLAKELGLPIQDGINKSLGGPTRTLEVKGSVDELSTFGKLLGKRVNPDMTAAQAREMAALFERQKTSGKGGAFVSKISDPESQKLAQKVIELKEIEAGDVVIKALDRPGSRVKDELGVMYELVGRTKNGWYKVRDKLGQEKNFRRKQFEVVDKAPAPRAAGPMELNPFSSTAAKIIAMNERVLNDPNKMVDVKLSWREQRKYVKDMEDRGIDITKKNMTDHWTPTELMFLRDTFDKQAHGIAELARKLESKLRNEGNLLDSDLAYFNNAHSIFVATRDLFHGVSGNAARQLNILRSKPTKGVYDFGQSMLDSISIQGGRANTERAIKMMADFTRKHGEPGKPGDVVRGINSISESIWGSPTAALLLNLRYNMMLSSWRTHFFNFLGNSASGIYEHGLVSPVRMGVNNINYVAQVAKGKLTGRMPDPADRMTRHQYYAELRGHYAGFFDSLALAKEIALGRDIGEGKVWGELGLRYNVINVPDSKLAKFGTSPVRLLEAGDAFFKHQYYNSKMHELASIKARYDEVHNGKNYKERYDYYLENPDGAAHRAAQDFAAKQTYTNDPSVYGGVLAALAKGVSTAQNKSLAVNMIVPFVRTPANLLSYSMDMIGANTVLAPGRTYNSIMKGTQRESQEAIARLTVAAGLWLAVNELYQDGKITGTGPTNWEERKVWEAAGWQANSIEIHGNWIELSRAAPAGQALTTIASVFDWYAMTKQVDMPGSEWFGAGLLYTADAIVDESYLSTVSDVIAAIQSKQPGKAQSIAASTINSILVPNLLRDLRRPADEVMRSSASPDMLQTMHKQMMNASPWHSADLPPSRDWKGDPKNYFGNAYVRAVVPFKVKDPTKTDDASLALAYSRVPVPTPNKTIAWPGGMGDAIDLFAMDQGGGYVYDEYLKIMGETRLEAVEILMDSRIWKKLAREDRIGPNSDGDNALRDAIGIGSKAGRLRMLDFLIKHSGKNNTYTRKGPEGQDVEYLIQHPVSVDTYIELRKAISRGEDPDTEELQQYRMKKPVEGPEFFKP